MAASVDRPYEAVRRLIKLSSVYTVHVFKYPVCMCVFVCMRIKDSVYLLHPLLDIDEDLVATVILKHLERGTIPCLLK